MNELECVRADLSARFIDDAEEKVEQEANFNMPPSDDFELRWNVGRELQRDPAGNLRVEWLPDQHLMQVRVWYKEVVSSNAAMCDF